MMTHDVHNMKAFACKTYGDVDTLQEITMSIPRIINPRDLLVRVSAVAVNPIDFKVRNQFGQGNKVQPPEIPRILGWDCCGVVSSTGDACTLFKSGDRVYFAGTLNRQGTNAEYVLVDERLVGIAPRSLDDSDVAAMALTTLTAWESLQEQMHIDPLDKKCNATKTMLILPGASGVGSIAIQLAKKVFNVGTVIGTASRPESREFATKMGADLVIDARVGIKSQLRQHNIIGVDYVFNCIDTHLYISEYSKIGKPMSCICSIVGGPGVDVGSYPDLYDKRMTFTYEAMFARSIYNVDMERQHDILNRVSRYLDDGTLVTTKTKQMTLTLDNLKTADRKSVV